MYFFNPRLEQEELRQRSYAEAKLVAAVRAVFNRHGRDSERGVDADLLAKANIQYAHQTYHAKAMERLRHTAWHIEESILKF